MSTAISSSRGQAVQSAGPARRRAAPAGRSWLVPVLIFAAVLVAGVALRFWHLGSSPAWQWDETVYYRVGINVQHGVLAEHNPVQMQGLAWQPFLYQPPFYFLLLARWFALTGASIYHARVLGVILTALMLPALFRLLWKIHGPRTALLAIIPIVFDGWLLYIERISYLENALVLVIVVAFLLYQRALERPSSLHRFAAAGAMIGFAAVFKQTGAYVLLAVLMCWLIVRRGHKGHLVLLGTTLAVIAVYVIAMTRMYDLPGRPWFTEQSLVQITRVLGLRQSGGTLTSASKLLHLLVAQYSVFTPSLLIGLAAFVLAVRRLVQCYLARNWLPARDNALLFSWLMSGAAVFGFSSLKFPQYFALILIPAYCFFWTELAGWNWRPAGKALAAVLAVAASVALFAITVPAFSQNPLQEVQQYAAAHIPRNAVVITEQTVGDLISQNYCTVENAKPCRFIRRVGLHPMYAITWKTYLQSSFTEGDPAFHALMKGAVRITSFSGAVGTATVWRLKGTP
jgi:4-amino-4-deoxy-L-arabinose transferase-like glycosyltransferase